MLFICLWKIFTLFTHLCISIVYFFNLKKIHKVAEYIFGQFFEFSQAYVKDRGFSKIKTIEFRCSFEIFERSIISSNNCIDQKYKEVLRCPFLVFGPSRLFQLRGIQSFSLSFKVERKTTVKDSVWKTIPFPANPDKRNISELYWNKR